MVHTKTGLSVFVGASSALSFAVLGGCAGEPGAETALATNASAISQSSKVSAVESVKRAFPDARVQMRNQRPTRVYGTILATGNSADQSADSVKSSFMSAYGSGGSVLTPKSPTSTGPADSDLDPRPIGVMYDRKTGNYKFWLYRYGQSIQGIPVHAAELLVLVKNEAGNPVVWANSSLRDLAGFVAPKVPDRFSVDRAKAVQAAYAEQSTDSAMLADPATLGVVDEPRFVIYAGDADTEAAPQLAVAFRATDSKTRGMWDFIADAASGDILHVENLLLMDNAWGTVRGNVAGWGDAPGCAASNNVPIPYAEVGILSGSSGLTSSTGYFNLTNPGTTPVQVTSTLHGDFFDVVNQAGTDMSLTQTVTPPNRVDFLHNAGNNQEFLIAQANAYYHANLARDFILRYVPEFPSIISDRNLTVRANVDPAYWSGCPGNAGCYSSTGEMLFCQQSAGAGGYRNFAFGSVLYHEFGHHVVWAAGSGQGAYGEGMGDTLGVIIMDDPRHDLGLNKNDAPPRDRFRRTADNDCMYDPDPAVCSTGTGCGSSIHDCGNLLSGVVWTLRQELRASHPADYLEVLRALTVNSILLHTGTRIDSDIADDFLALDDDDGTIANGTPHGAEICAAFSAHGIACPLTPTQPDTPCTDICPSPLVFNWTGSYQSGQLGTGSICREPTQAVAGGNCGNLAAGRTLSVNNVVMPCNNLNWTWIPPARHGGYCITTTPGNYEWAFFTLW